MDPAGAARALAAVALAIASLFWLWRAADPGAVWPLLQRAHPPALVLGVALLGGSLVTKALRWRAMLPAPGAMGRGEATRIFHVSILLNNLLPFRVGDGVRVLSPSVRRVASIQQALVTLLAERALDGLTLALVALVALPPFFRSTGRQAVVDGLTAPGKGALVLLVGGFAIGIVALAIVARIRWHALRALFVDRIQSLRADTLAIIRQPRTHLVYLAAMTAAGWGATFLMHTAVLEALDPPEALVGPILLGVIVTLSTNLSMLAPATPGGIGLFHAAAAAPLLVAGYSSELAVAYALLVHVINTVPPMLVGAVSLAWPTLTARLRRGTPT